MKKRMRFLLVIFTITAILIGGSGCGKAKNNGLSALFASKPAPTNTPFQPLPPTADALPDPNTAAGSEVVITQTQAATASPTAEQPIKAPGNTVWIDPLLPVEIRASITIPQGWAAVEKDQANLVIGFGTGHPLADWYFCLVAPFPTVQDSISATNLQSIWNGSPPSHLENRKIVMSQFTATALEALWGKTSGSAVSVVEETDLLGTAWENAATWAIIPFEDLEPRWKVLAVDGISPVHNDFNGLDYALRIPVSLQGSAGMVEALLRERAVDRAAMPTTNRDGSKLTVLAMTGVTALVRATAFTMENIGINYPGQAIHDWLVEADLTHISNEVPFAEDCPFPNPVQSGVTFCSDPRYISLLEFVGTDIVELTGDHFHDWGTPAMYYTLAMYEERGWPFYGGGYNLGEGKKPVTMEHNGNRLAFIGCNGKGGEFASASVNSPGSAACDFPYMEAEIKRLVSEGYLPIATFQHHEYYYYEAQPAQIRDFRRLADAGALIVSGSQAHQPQGMEFYNGAWLHYGLGNLFFDQYLLGTPMRQGFIDRHIFYDNRYISTELLTIWFVDYAQPRPMTPDERSDLLQTIFRASGW